MTALPISSPSPLPPLMRAMVLREPGGPDALRPEQIARPDPGVGEVLIRVRATSVNPVDLKLRQAPGLFTPELPAVLHGDVAGEVVACGPGVTAFATGQAVFGCIGGVRGRPGALAEYVCADVRLLAAVPAWLGWRRAAAMPLVFITAWQALVERCAVGPGMSVLVLGGAGGVGHMAVQLARALGARVFATVSTPEKIRMVEYLGATPLPRSLTVPELLARAGVGAGFDVVFDTVGGQALSNALALARPEGAVATCQGNSVQDLTLAHQKALSIHAVLMLLPLLGRGQEDRLGRIMAQAADLAARGAVLPHLDPHVFSMEAAGSAHAHLAGGGAVGKVVIDGFPPHLPEEGATVTGGPR